MGFNRLGTVFCISGLCGSMVFYRQRKYRHAVQVEDKYNLLGGVIGAFITITVIQSMGKSGACAGGYAYCHFSACGGYLIELLGIFGVERADFQWRKLLGNADLYCRCGYFQMEIEIKVL